MMRSVRFQPAVELRTLTVTNPVPEPAGMAPSTRFITAAMSVIPLRRKWATIAPPSLEMVA